MTSVLHQSRRFSWLHLYRICHCKGRVYQHFYESHYHFRASKHLSLVPIQSSVGSRALGGVEQAAAHAYCLQNLEILPLAIYTAIEGSTRILEFASSENMQMFAKIVQYDTT